MSDSCIQHQYLGVEDAKAGAIEAEKVMKQFGYSDQTIKHVKEMILAHSCDTRLLPKTLEGKILTSADAMSHYINDFYLTLASTGEYELAGFKKWALEKLEKDYNKKIFFDKVNSDKRAFLVFLNTEPKLKSFKTYYDKAIKPKYSLNEIQVRVLYASKKDIQQGAYT